MTKSVLVISASPRKGGNSDTLCEQFIEGAKSSGHEAAKIHVTDCHIGYCKGCFACVKSGAYVQKDDVAGILQQMTEAHVIVLATPVYFYTRVA